MTKFSTPIWHVLHNVKLKMKMLPIFVAFLENMNFTKNKKLQDSFVFWKYLRYITFFRIKIALAQTGAVNFMTLMDRAVVRKKSVRSIYLRIYCVALRVEDILKPFWYLIFSCFAYQFRKFLSKCWRKVKIEYSKGR